MLTLTAALLAALTMLPEEPADSFSLPPDFRAASEMIPVSDQYNAQVWRSRLMCGVNAAYLMWKWNSDSANYEEVSRDVLIGPRGTSAQSIRDFLRSRGLKADVVAAGIRLLEDSSYFPFIAHLEEQESYSGHYVLVFGVNERSVSVIDGTSGSVQTMPKPEFLRLWTQHAIVLQRMEWTDYAVRFGVVIAIFQAGWLLYRRRAVGKAGVTCTGV